jgi:enoyl-CoA hydratase/carnithine racemase
VNEGEGPMNDLKLHYGEYAHIAMSRTDGILEMRFHTGDGPLVWSRSAHAELTEAFAAVAADCDNKVVILTGTGDAYCEYLDHASFENATTTPLDWSRIERDGIVRLRSILDIPCPVIAAINGPARVHAEMALLSDIVLASTNAVFQDKPHFPNGVVPGDGVHVVWPLLLGMNRGRYFLLTGQELSAQESCEASTTHTATDPSLPDARVEATHARQPRVRLGARGPRVRAAWKLANERRRAVAVKPRRSHVTS